MKCEVVAEAGVNHQGYIDRALELCDAAKEAGANVVKFQTFVPEKSIKPDSKDFQTLADLALPLSAFVSIANHCADIGIEFMSTPDDLDSLRCLVEECGVKRIKIGSGSLTYRPLLRAAFATGLPVILSTGMATSHEVYDAVRESTGNPHKLTLLQCTSLYPCPDRLVNLSAMDSLRVYGAKVGYSDHTDGGSACIAAAAMGADMVEKHFKIDEDCIDAHVSIMPQRFADMVKSIRQCEVLRGDGRKFPSDEERAMIPRVRKGDDGLQPGL